MPYIGMEDVERFVKVLGGLMTILNNVKTLLSQLNRWRKKR